MRTLAAKVAAALTVLLIALSVPFASPAAADTVSDEAQFAASLNEVRASKGLPALPIDVRLRDVARRWSGVMAAESRLYHNPNLANEAPSDWQRLAENVGYGSSVDSIHRALVNSPGHHANIVDANVNLLGIGVVRSGDRVWVTQVFMKASSAELLTASAPASSGPVAGGGYRIVTTGGGVYDFGTAASPGSVPGSRIVGGAATPSRNGYWVVGEDGTVHARGDAPDFGGLGGRPLTAPIVGMAATPTGGGYWLLGRDGGVFSFGDARFFGSTGNMRLNKPVVGMAATPTGGGYWFVASDGGIFGFGDAAFFGSTGAIALSQPIVGMAPTRSGGGYWLVARDGGIFSFGDAGFFGSTGAIALNQPIVGMAPSASGNGYRFVAADGGIFNFGDAPYAGSGGGMGLGRSVVGMLAG